MPLLFFFSRTRFLRYSPLLVLFLIISVNIYSFSAFLIHYFYLHKQSVMTEYQRINSFVYAVYAYTTFYARDN